MGKGIRSCRRLPNRLGWGGAGSGSSREAIWDQDNIREEIHGPRAGLETTSASTSSSIGRAPHKDVDCPGIEASILQQWHKATVLEAAGIKAMKTEHLCQQSCVTKRGLTGGRKAGGAGGTCGRAKGTAALDKYTGSRPPEQRFGGATQTPSSKLPPSRPIGAVTGTRLRLAAIARAAGSSMSSTWSTIKQVELGSHRK